MNRLNEPSFDAEVTLVDLPSETEGVDPLALFDSESESPEALADTPAIAGKPVVSSRVQPLPAQARKRGPLPLDHLLQRLGRVEWTEAVAIVEALCGVLTERESQRVPEISRVAITFEGTVIVGTAASKDGVGPVLARMIHALAAGGSVPAPLRLFVTKWASASESHSIADFAKELAFFARPDGQELVRAVYERAMATAVQVKPVGKTPSDAPRKAPRVQPRPRSRANSGVLYAAAAAVVVLGVLATAVFAWRNAPAAGPILTSSNVPLDASNTAAAVPALLTAEGVSEIFAAESRPPGSAIGRAAATRLPSVAVTGGARSTAAAAPQAPANRIDGPRTSSPVSSAVRASLAAPISPSPRSVPASAAADPSRAVLVAPARPPRRGEGGPPVYSRLDSDVIPPAFLHPQLPGQILSGLRPDMNTLELIVSETGSVERVRLLSTPKRMADMMLLSGAKNWEFEPAVKDGQPVRYRLELSWAATP